MGIKNKHYKNLLLRRLIFTNSFAPAFSICCLQVLFSNALYAQKDYHIDNPVLPGVRDVGAIKFNGTYYLGGMGTDGGFYMSEDMVHWEGPVHVFSMDNAWTPGESAKDLYIHAGDINYINGTFHFYWSVNYWGTAVPTVHIGHATASNILGPYHEPETNTWFDNRIDAELFVDDDGQPYFYTVKFTDGNTIWGNKMINPGSLSPDPKYLFASMLHTWETYDSRVAEGPWVIKYRNRYYLMYNANHTAPRFGNYALGVVEADGPLAFNHGNKYPYPVVESNQVYLEDHFVDLLKYPEGAALFVYTLQAPAQDWTGLNFTADAWQKGKPGFGSAVTEHTATRKVHTLWKSDEIWIRKPFILQKADVKNLMMRIHHEGSTEVYVNGQRMYAHEGENYTTWNLDEQAKSYLRDGKNVIAVHSRRGPQEGYLDIALFEMQAQQGDDILYVSGQPSILHGPNGFEWWLVYFTMKNGDPPGQFIDRVHFFDKELYVDGPTASHTPGYHPLPAPPTFGDNFTQAENLESRWKIMRGNWHTENKELKQTGSQAGQVLIKSIPATHYLFEAGVKMGKHAGKAGIYAYWQDEHNYLQVVLDPQEKNWAYTLKENDKVQTASYALFPDFALEAYHTLTVYKNAGDFEVKIDQLPAPGSPWIRTDFDNKGIPGLCTEGTPASFDGVLYTTGWDESDQTIRGWGASVQGSPQKGVWQISDDGLWQTRPSGISQVYKGDLLEHYEVCVQVTAADVASQGSAGLYPVFADSANYLKALIDYQQKALVVSGKIKGKEINSQKISLHSRHPYFADMRYSDFIEKHFTLKAPAYIKAIEFYKSPHFLPDTTIEDIHRHVEIAYQQEGIWYPLTAYQQDVSAHPAFDKITFAPVRAEALRMVNRQDENYVYKIFVQEDLKSTYNLRVAKLADAIIVVLDGKEVLRIKNQWPASQVGLITDNMEAGFNGIMLYHLP